MGDVINTASSLVIRSLGADQPYEPTWQAMQAFTRDRDEHTLDEIWLLEHEPVFTLGRNGKREHILAAGDIPIVPIDRGGQVTYHGKGQLIAYLLLNIRRKGIGIRELVEQIENAIIYVLAQYGIEAQGDRNAPGVYVRGKKIAALGLRVSKGCTYHGLSFNIDMDLEPFLRINPCGYAGLEVTQCKDLGVQGDLPEVAKRLCQRLAQQLNYENIEWL